MASNKLNLRLTRTKLRSATGTYPTESQTSEDNSSTMPDLSILRKSITTSVTGFAQARTVFDTGTNELRQLLSNECDIIYECRVCRNLFRSLANFISHKRVYCCEKFNSSLHPHFSNSNYKKDDVITILQTEEEYQEFVKNKDKLVNNDQNVTVPNSKKYSATKDLTSIIERLLNKNDSGDNTSHVDLMSTRQTNYSFISNKKESIYQNICDKPVLRENSIAEEIAELDKMISSNEAVLGPDGKLLGCRISDENFKGGSCTDRNQIQSSFQDNLFCKICKISFSSLKTKKFHIKHKHTNNRLVYPCPDCTDTFSNSWSVFRHLFKVHRKSATHIRKLRETIHNKAYKLDISSVPVESKACDNERTNSLSEQQRRDQENQAWIDNLEGDGDIPRCGGCGKSFERRAALSSHRHTCQLRKTAQSKINSNSQKKFLSRTNKIEELNLSEPQVKIAKLDRPLEKRIEIKIRKDYNKTSPIISRTFSPTIADEDSTAEVSNTNDHNKIGENENELASSIDVNNSFINDDVVKTVKDCDDANVDVNFEKNLTDSSNDANDDSNCVDSDDINFDDIKRICSEDDMKPNDKACGQNVNSEILNDDQRIASDIIDLVGNKEDSIVDKVEDPISTIGDEPENGVYQCAYCDVTFTFKQKLQRHIARHLIWMKYECKICGIKSCNASKYAKHMRTQHQMVSTSSRLLQIASKMIPKSSKISNNENSGKDVSNNSIKSEEYSMDLSESFEDDDQSRSALNCDKVNKRTPPKKSLKADQTKISIGQDNSTTIEDEMIQIIEDASPENSVSSDNQTFSSQFASISEKTKSKINIKKTNQHIASSESYTVRRPVRNRIKNFDKDFEYDSSYLPKIKNENRESNIVALSQKSQLKRKQFLQNESLPEEPTKPSQDTNQSLIKSNPIIVKTYQGSLKTISVKIATQGKAQMRMKRTLILRRDTPPFLRTPYRMMSSVTECPPMDPVRILPVKSNRILCGTETTAVPLKVLQMKTYQPLSTVSKISEKSSLESNRLRIGASVLMPRKMKVLNTNIRRCMSPNILGIQKKKILIQQSQKLPTKSLQKFDHQALSKSTQSGEITMLSKSSTKVTSAEGNSDSSVDSLSILPSSGKNNASFMNISLKQLKNLQRCDITTITNNEIDDETLTKNMYALKNLEGNNQIKISKVLTVKKETIDKSLISPANKEIIHKSMAKAFRETLIDKKFKKIKVINPELMSVKTNIPLKVYSNAKNLLKNDEYLSDGSGESKLEIEGNKIDGDTAGNDNIDFQPEKLITCVEVDNNDMSITLKGYLENITEDAL